MKISKKESTRKDPVKSGTLIEWYFCNLIRAGLD